MRSTKLGLVLVGLAVLTACPDGGDTGGDTSGDNCDTFDTGCSDSDSDADLPTQLNNLSFNCAGDSAPGDVWSFGFEASGDAALVELTLVETGAAADIRWTEAGHTSDANLGIALTAVEGTGNVVIATSGTGGTAFHCAWNNGASLAYKAELIDSTNGVADCAIWGYHASSDAFPGSSCLCWDADGDCSN